DDEAQRAVKLVRWLPLPEHLYMRLDDDSTVPARYDQRQVGTDRVSSVQYLKFDTGGRPPVAIGCSFDDPEVGLEVALSPEQWAALEADLAG
ncbi:MAG: DUF3501 family protein, partial [Myxococcota bacterium]|nr:DUF3501 family protein [Myxococcota bacterium]